MIIETKEKSHSKPNGGVAQLGEHLPCKQGVMGSNPIISIEGPKGPSEAMGLWVLR